MSRKVPNINCKHYEWGMCNKKPRRLFGLFKSNCPEVKGKTCGIKEKFPKPPAPPPFPPKKSLTEGSIRMGMKNYTSNSLRPIYPPPAPKSKKEGKR